MTDLLQSASEWVTQYGSIAIFCLLALGIVGLPIPDETLLVFTGVLIARGKLHIFATPVAAYFGSCLGITLSYLLGYATEKLFIEKYGPWIGITEKKLNKVRHWFDKIDKWVLFFGYFIPGVRHLTGYIAGTTQMSVKRFMTFAYIGALVWCLTFLTIGYVSGYLTP